MKSLAATPSVAEANIGLLFGIFSPNNADEIIKNSEGIIQNAADALQKSFIEGLGEQCSNVEILNLPYIGSYPRLYHKVIINGGDFHYTTQSGRIVHGRDVGFCNIVGIKNYFRYRNALQAIKQWCKSTDGRKIVVVYAIHTPFLKACVTAKKHCKNLKIVLIVPDLPEFMGQKPKEWYKRYFHALNRRMLQSLYEDVDGYVLLSKYMTDRLPIDKKPWVVIEGIFNKTKTKHLEIKKDAKFILYTGTLARRYGILNLVEAFSKTTRKDFQLIICGAGDTESVIKEYAAKDTRIIFKGQVRREEALLLQQQATLLINPRSPEGEFTKYSFPSKTMEYMASGVPCLLYKLPGIPDEYFEHCLTIDEIGIEALTARLTEAMSMSKDELEAIGRRSRNFIYKKKNPTVQTNKLIKLFSII